MSYIGTTFKQYLEEGDINEIKREVTDSTFEVYNVGNEELKIVKTESGLTFELSVKGKTVSYPMSLIDVKRLVKWIKQADKKD